MTELNKEHYFEVGDRVHVINCTIEDFILKHPTITPEMRNKIIQAQELLSEVYQWAGSMYDDLM